MAGVTNFTVVGLENVFTAVFEVVSSLEVNVEGFFPPLFVDRVDDVFDIAVVVVPRDPIVLTISDPFVLFFAVPVTVMTAFVVIFA